MSLLAYIEDQLNFGIVHPDMATKHYAKQKDNLLNVDKHGQTN